MGYSVNSGIFSKPHCTYIGSHSFDSEQSGKIDTDVLLCRYISSAKRFCHSRMTSSILTIVHSPYTLLQLSFTTDYIRLHAHNTFIHPFTFYLSLTFMPLCLALQLCLHLFFCHSSHILAFMNTIVSEQYKPLKSNKLHYSIIATSSSASSMQLTANTSQFVS